jgi:RNA polymerase sigma-70 factor (ECF subfamily)
LWRLSKRRLDRLMITAELSTHPTPGGFAEVAQPAAIPAPLTRVVSDDASDSGAFSGGGRSEGGGTLPPSAFAGGTASRELPAELIAGAVRGDGRAREKLLALIHPLVLRYCRGRLGRRETALGSADDVAQDVCMAVVNALQTYQPKGLSFRAFVYGIAAHKVTDAFRAIGRDRTEPVAELPDTPVTAEGPERRVLDAERDAALRALLAHLTPRQREVLVLRLAVGESAEETAEAVGSTPGAVRVTQHRALLRLRRIIAHGASADAAAELDAGDAAHLDTEPST